MEKQSNVSTFVSDNITHVTHILINKLKKQPKKSFFWSIEDEIKKKPLIWSAAIFVIFIIILVCLCYVRKIIMGIRGSGENAYNNLVRSGFFKKWLIRDLNGLIYNATGVPRQE